jgi:hypothetical protein
MKTTTTYHNFWIFIKIEIECMHLVVAIFFGSIIKTGLQACISRGGGGGGGGAPRGGTGGGIN